MSTEHAHSDRDCPSPAAASTISAVDDVRTDKLNTHTVNLKTLGDLATRIATRLAYIKEQVDTGEGTVKDVVSASLNDLMTLLSEGCSLSQPLYRSELPLPSWQAAFADKGFNLRFFEAVNTTRDNREMQQLLLDAYSTLKNAPKDPEDHLNGPESIQRWSDDLNEQYQEYANASAWCDKEAASSMKDFRSATKHELLRETGDTSGTRQPDGQKSAEEHWVDYQMFKAQGESESLRATYMLPVIEASERRVKALPSED